MSISPQEDSLNFTNTVSTMRRVSRGHYRAWHRWWWQWATISWIARQQRGKWNLVGLAKQDILQFIVIRNITVMAVLMLFQFTTSIICKETIMTHTQEWSASNFYSVWCNFCIIFRLYLHIRCNFCFFCIIIICLLNFYSISLYTS